jgi:hypothetical protein
MRRLAKLPETPAKDALQEQRCGGAVLYWSASPPGLSCFERFILEGVRL